MKVLYPTNVAGRPEPPPGVTLVDYDPSAPIPERHHDAQVLVSWGSTRELMRAAATQLTGLRWVLGRERTAMFRATAGAFLSFLRLAPAVLVERYVTRAGARCAS